MNCRGENIYNFSIPFLHMNTTLCLKDTTAKSCLKNVVKTYSCCPKEVAIVVSINLDNVEKCTKSHCCVYNILRQCSCVECQLRDLIKRNRLVWICYFLEMMHDSEWVAYGGRYYKEKCCFVDTIRPLKPIQLRQEIDFCVQEKLVMLRFTDYMYSVPTGSYFFALGLDLLVKMFHQCKHRSVPTLQSMCLYQARETLNKSNRVVYIPPLIIERFKELEKHPSLFLGHIFYDNPGAQGFYQYIEDV